MTVLDTGGMDVGNLTKLAGEMRMADNLFGGNDGNGGGFIMGALLGRLLFNQNGENGNQNADRAAIDSAVAAALANANQANSNSMLLLKDIQDTGQDLTSTITSGNQTLLVSQLQAQIANLQGQGDIKSAVALGNANIINETHEQTQTVTNQLDNITVAMLNGFNQTQGVVRDDGDKTRALITQNMITELNNQIADLRTARTVAEGGVNVTNNINQNQLQQQQQQQMMSVTSALGVLAGQLNRNQQDIINLGTMSGQAGQQTAANTNIR